MMRKWEVQLNPMGSGRWVRVFTHRSRWFARMRALRMMRRYQTIARVVPEGHTPAQPPTWANQVSLIPEGMSRRTQIAWLNAQVTPCAPAPRVFGLLWRYPQHSWDDYTSTMQTATYDTLDRCEHCGLLQLGSGL